MPKVLINARVLQPNGQSLPNQSIVIENELIVWSGDHNNLPEPYCHQPALFEDCQGQLITPGLIDCHTHLVYAGDRANEFRLRLQGASYTEIARAGGGILSTVRQTRAVSEEQLLEQSLPRLLALQAEGVTTVEIKSGYGLDTDTELKMLRVARLAGVLTGLRVKTTFLGAHALPLEFLDQRDAYVDYLCQDMLPAVVESGLADAVDVFCENIAFTLKQTERIFKLAQSFKLPIKCHADQLSNMGASTLSANMNALSCDHLEYLNEEGIMAMAKSNTTAVLLPGAYYFLGETQCPPIDLLRQHQVRMAIASDSNPGTSPTTSLLLMMSMACRYFRLTIAETMQAVTCHAASALGMSNEIGTIAVGFAADLVRWKITDEAALCYHFASPIAHETMQSGCWLNK